MTGTSEAPKPEICYGEIHYGEIYDDLCGEAAKQWIAGARAASFRQRTKILPARWSSAIWLAVALLLVGFAPWLSA